MPCASVVTKPVHLVISDFNMPKLDGLGLLRAIRAHPPIQTTAFIMLTGRADRELVQRAVQFGVNNYLVKPFTVGPAEREARRRVRTPDMSRPSRPHRLRIAANPIHVGQGEHHVTTIPTSC
jgi:PleD family two-component response regulator